MKWFRLLVAISVLSLWPWGNIGHAALATVPGGETVVVPIQGEISKAQFYFLRRAVKDAEERKAAAIILDLNTYGGELSAATKMLEVLFKTKVPTIAYVNPNAGSAGALISLAAKKIYMAPVSAIGAAAPVSGGGENLPSTMNDKVVSYFSGYFRSAAEKNGYNPDLAEAFMNKTKEVKIGDEVVHKAGTLLTLSAQEACRLLAGKPLLATGTADSLEDLQRREKLGGEIVRLEPSGFEQLALWLTALAPVLLLGGIVLGYLELKTPGFGLAGLGSAICFGLFFAGQFVAGLAGWEVAALFFLGVLFVISELFVHPGTIIPGFIGLLLMVGALIWAMVDRYPSDPWLPTAAMLTRPLATLLCSGLLAALAIGFLAKYLPELPLFRGLVLHQANAAGPSLPGPGVGSHSQYSQSAPIAPGTEGVAVTTLRPSGKARIGGEVVDVITSGEYLERETPVQVREVIGSRIVVQATLPA